MLLLLFVDSKEDFPVDMPNMMVMVKTKIGSNFSVGNMTTGIRIRNMGFFWEKKKVFIFWM